MSKVNTVSPAMFSIQVVNGIKSFTKIRSITLLIAGIIMAIIHTHLFTAI
ncbi:MAG: hypothetical protein ACI35P_10275 [Bacillus sp. (in: firmicutes)]